MAVLYLLVVFYVLLINFTEIPGLLLGIVEQAFGLKEAVGGILSSIKNNYMFMGRDETGEYDLFKHTITREYIKIPNDNYFINNAKIV